MSRHDLLRQPPRGTRRSGLRGSLRLGALFALLVGVNIYVFFFRDNTSINELLRTGSMQRAKAKKKARKKPPAAIKGSQALGGKAAKGQPAVREHAIAPGEQLVRGSLEGHNGLASALKAAKLELRDIGALIKALEPKLDLRTLRPTHRFEVYKDAAPPHRLKRFVFRLSPIKSVVATRRRDGSLRARLAEKKLRVVRARIGARITSSLDQAIAATGESSTLIYRLLRLFAWDINWSTDVRKGDSFRLIVEKRYLEGKRYGYGKLLAAEYKGAKTGVQRAFYHRTRDGDGGYYTPQGRNVRRPLVKTPINYRRISSGFNHKRFHPVLHKVKAHLGVDYAAAPGTPIYAAGDGVVTWARRSGPAGKMVKIRHDGGVVSVYMHMSRYARGMKRGKKVKQWQVIGYVGSTGRATGPHLHFGLKVNGRYIDPMGYSVPRGKLLPRYERARYKRGIAKLARQLGSIPLTGKRSDDDGKDALDSSKDVPGQDDDDLWS
jgi:murein DD-endopeptidase MepM/ murein hydrolase activator NlpD